MKKNKVLKVAEPGRITAQGNSPADMIRMAVAGNADLDKLEKLLFLQKDWEANEARKIFASSFATAQANIGAVLKTKMNPQTHSKYADLGDIIESAKPIYTKEGFAIIFYEGVTSVPESIRICADVLHKSGHRETYFYDVPLDGKGIQGNANMTKIHGKSSSTSYGRRYLMCMIWNIPTQDDNDGNGSQKPVVVKPKTKPVVVKPEVKPVITKGLSDKAKNGFKKAQVALGDKDFFAILGSQGYEKVEQITNEGVALQIVRDMETVYKEIQENNGK